jgi:dTDP-4-dehydrorhamnose reductase
MVSSYSNTAVLENLDINELPRINLSFLTYLCPSLVLSTLLYGSTIVVSMKVLITGASGFVGRHLTEDLSLSGLIYPVFKNNVISDHNAEYCELQDYKSVQEMLGKTDPDVIVHCAASSNIEECEKKLDSWENNVIGTSNLIGDYSEDSMRNPINWYGYTKVACEDMVSNLVPIHTIVRLSYQYAYDSTNKNFIHKALEKLILDQTVFAVDDLICYPT